MSMSTQEKNLEKAGSPFAASVADVDVDVATGDVRDARAKNFSLWSTLGIAFSLTSTPIGVGTYLSVSIGVGGSPVFFFGYLLAGIMDLFVCFSLAEMASVLPNSSGQIFWTAVLAPKKYARGLSYVVGWLTVAGYFFWTAAAFLISSQLIWALVQICQESFVTHPWHFYVVYLAIGLFALLVNGPLIRLYPYMLKGLVVYINCGALFVMVALLSRSSPKQSAEYVFVDIVNQTGWSSNGVVFFVGLLPGLTAINGFDCAAHMSEEVPNPKREIPQVMCLSAIASFVAGIPMILVYMFCITNPDNLLAPVGGQPVAQLMLDSLDSMALTVICMIIFIVTFACCAATTLTTWSRVWWSLAREYGTPMPEFMARIDKKSNLPYNSLIFATLACAVVGVLELGSSLALNAILGGAIICIFSSYAVPIICSLLDRRRVFAQKHYFDLGRAGMVINIVAVCWIAFAFVWLCFPLYVPYTNANMNWAIVVFAGILAISGINWVAFSRTRFRVPEAIDAGYTE